MIFCSHGILFRLVADFPSQHWHSKPDSINREEQSASENLYTKKGTICQGKLQIIKESIFTGSMREQMPDMETRFQERTDTVCSVQESICMRKDREKEAKAT